MMTAVKDGQAFDPATSEQKKNTFVCPASQSQRKALGGMRKALFSQLFNK